MNAFPKIRLMLAAAAIMVASATASIAQTAPQKIGYTNVDYVLSKMPESKQVESQLKDYSTQLENQLKAKYTEFQTKGEAYQKGASTMTDVVRADKEKELQNLQQSIQEFQRNADASIQQKQQTLLKPVLDKLQKTIDQVADENGYAYVFNSDAGYGTTPILLHGPKDGDISDLVLKKMGIDPNAAPAAAAPAAAKPAAATPAPAAGKTKTKTKKN